MPLLAPQSERLRDFLIVWTRSRSFIAYEASDLVEQSKPSIKLLRLGTQMPTIISGLLDGRPVGADAQAPALIRQGRLGLYPLDCVGDTMGIPILYSPDGAKT
ncbi:TPA: hypothetical protein QDE31_02845 [Burkholderia cenocepacia]|nr:hypothetical protein [Burkholderia cenocepacia]